MEQSYLMDALSALEPSLAYMQNCRIELSYKNIILRDQASFMNQTILSGS